MGGFPTLEIKDDYRQVMLLALMIITIFAVYIFA